MTVVDRSSSATVHFDYDIPEEDTVRTADEVENSRTHQFFVLSKQTTELPPVWISWNDITRAAMVDPEVRPTEIDEDDVLETSSMWHADEWIRITSDEDRRPITFEQAAEGVDWDTTAVAQGTYVVWGYTYEPTRNLWSPRWGAVKVVDRASDPASSPPSVFLMHEEVVLEAGERHPLPGCVDTMPGSTITAWYGVVLGTNVAQWIPFAQRIPVDSGELSLVFEAPAFKDSVTNVRIRVDIEDPHGRTYTAYSPRVMPVNPAADDGPPPANDGCGCRADMDGSIMAWLVCIVLAVARCRSHGRARA